MITCSCPEKGWTDVSAESNLIPGVDCKDIDECANNTANCDQNAVCFNTPGSYQCQCKPGFSGDGFNCTDVNECTSDVDKDTCVALATCQNTDGSFKCVCKSGYHGDGTKDG